VIATQIVHIGKEANKWEERYFLGDDDDNDADVEYGVGDDGGTLDVAIRKLCEAIGQRSAAEQLSLSRTALLRALKLGADALSRSTRAKVRRAMLKPDP
jgi:hypothetical protein